VTPPPGAGFFATHTVEELAADLRGGRLSPGDLVEHALAAATALDPKLNAFVTLDEAGARGEARRAAEELAAGRDRGPLHGIPVAIKDLVDTAGLRTTAGSRHFADRVPETDAECVRSLREAGAVVLGKTVTHELAYGPTGDRSANGPARNPYRPDAMSGGSSAGSAVAVAAGIVPLAIGTDTGGSVRIPAACCGIVGLRPTFGALPLDGVFPLSSSLDTVGPMARTVADCRLLWQALSNTRPFTDDPPTRIGWVPPATFHPTLAAVTDAARALVPNADEVAVPYARKLLGAYRIIQGCEAYAVHAERLASAPELFGDEVLSRLRAAGEIRGWEYVRARTDQRRAIEEIPRLFADHDVLALPTIPIPAPPLDARTGRIGDTQTDTETDTETGGEIDIRAALLSLTSAWSVLGLPALSIPAGTVDGLPVGLQLVAPPGGEELLLAVAEGLGQPPVR
jgi:Asp-tRNA(Asn)/Glu-tRNA(Gln) amidotransferase A subunit family amidase